MKVSLVLCSLLVGVGCVLGAGFAQAQDKAPQAGFPVVTGEHWKNATPQEKLAFVAGMATIIELEKEVQGAAAQPQAKSLIPGWVKGLSQYRLSEIVAALDAYFAKKPDKLDRPVVEVLWVEVAEPNNTTK